MPDDAPKYERPFSLARDMVWPEEVLEEIDPYFDNFGRGPHPSQVGGRTFMLAVPGMIEQFRRRRVPDEMVSVALNERGFSAAEISCRCGEVHEIEIGGMVSADCGRIFLWFGKGVMWAQPEDDGPECICPADETGREYVDPTCPRCYPAATSD